MKEMRETQTQTERERQRIRVKQRKIKRKVCRDGSTSLIAYIKMCLFTRKINNLDADVVVYLRFLLKLFYSKWPYLSLAIPFCRYILLSLFLFRMISFSCLVGVFFFLVSKLHFKVYAPMPWPIVLLLYHLRINFSFIFRFQINMQWLFALCRLHLVFAFVFELFSFIYCEWMRR